MTVRLAVLTVLLSVSAAGAQPALPAPPTTPPAQQQPPQQSQPRGQAGDRSDIAPGPGPQERATLESAEVRQRLLDQLFQKLREASSKEEADGIDDAIEAVWARSGSPTQDLIFSWALQEAQRGNRARAFDYLDTLIVLAPDFPEAYYRRAQLFFATREWGKAMADLERTLALEPRHYGALAGVGTLLRDVERRKEALAAFQAALALHPHLEIAKRAVEVLRPRVEGRDS